MSKFKKSLAATLSSLLLAMSTPTESTAGFSTATDWQISKSEWRKSTGGYLTSISNYRGLRVNVFVTCPAKSFSLAVAKLGNFYEGSLREVISTSSFNCVNQSEIPSHKWSSNISFDTSQLEAGMYLIKVMDSDGFKSLIPLIIKEKSRKSSAIFVIPTMTMFAYNSWSGKNTYKGRKDFEDRLRVVDFRKPFDTGFGTGKYWKYVHPLILEVEKLGIDIDYLADTDIHFSPELLNNRVLYISAGHDEYWTREERENVIKARKNGMNLIFFGANAGYWQVRLKKDKASSAIVMEIFKDKMQDPNKRHPTIRFRDAGIPESQLNGLQYTCFPAKGSFEYFDRTFFGFKGMSEVDFIKLNEIVGPEVDETPKVNIFAGNINIVAEGRVRCGNRRIIPKMGRINMVFGTSTNGGGVFSVGTMGWVLNGLAGNADKSLKEAVVTVTRNVVLKALEGPFSPM